MTIRHVCGCLAAGMVLGLALLVMVAAAVVELADGSLYKEPACTCRACVPVA